MCCCQSSFLIISTVSASGYPTSRKELLCLDYPPKDPKVLVEYIESDSVIECQADFLFECASDADEVGEAETWKEWIEADSDAAYCMAVDLEKWVVDHPDEADWERADLNGLSGRGDALQFFDGQRELAEQFNIVIVWGDHPSSTYYAAELRMDIPEANAIAEAQGLPIRFGWDDVAMHNHEMLDRINAEWPHPLSHHDRRQAAQENALLQLEDRLGVTIDRSDPMIGAMASMEMALMAMWNQRR
jgi:hypothetical protein